ncbi:Zinc finger, RING-type [Corchorus olitorius]|uniref:RING-type E3 ubiquitin transferase n=1 Tax=Corchorus olitorius TaxID=93759 RepID=A0A1R3GJM3_9ROSI|nr:Zinc finger, RING-type [Corchorus olitorius]
MASGSSKYHLVVVSSGSSVPLTEEIFDLDEAMTLPENPFARQQGIARLVSDMPTVHNATGNCSICMESFRQKSDDDDDVLAARQVSCGHVYHHSCISDWLLNGNSYSCPLCRHEISG